MKKVVTASPCELLATILNRSFTLVRYRAFPWTCDDKIIEATLGGWLYSSGDELSYIIPEHIGESFRYLSSYKRNGIDSLPKIGIKTSRILPEQ